MGLPNVAPKRRATAVIAVHGVGDQKPFETARKIGDLLQELITERRDPSKKPPKCADPGPEQPRYYPFREQWFRINVNPVVMSEKASDSADSRSSGTGTRGPFNSWVHEAHTSLANALVLNLQCTLHPCRNFSGRLS